jgi:hypothetical protein
MMMEIVEGCIIEGPFWPEPVAILGRFEYLKRICIHLYFR